MLKHRFDPHSVTDEELLCFIERLALRVDARPSLLDTYLASLESLVASVEAHHV